MGAFELFRGDALDAYRNWPAPATIISDGAYGVRAAAQTFFGKRPSELQAQDATLLAAVLPNPARLHVRNPSTYVRERAAWIEEQMA